MSPHDTAAAKLDDLPRWDLSDLYVGRDDPRLEADLTAALGDAKAFAARGGQVLGVAIDRPDAVRTFLAKTPVGYPIAVAGFEALPVLG